jgi:hypothetical protein
LHHREHGSLRAGRTLDSENESANRKVLLGRWGHLPADEQLFVAALYLDEAVHAGGAEETLRRLLAADDLPAALREHEAELDAGLLALVRRDVDLARKDGQAELAEGLQNLAEYIEDVLRERKSAKKTKHRGGRGAES